MNINETGSDGTKELLNIELLQNTENMKLASQHQIPTERYQVNHPPPSLPSETET